MDANELVRAHEELIAKFEDDKHKLMLQYVHENAKFKVGDIISDCPARVIVITQITYQTRNTKQAPSIYYRGRFLTKKMEPRKDGAATVMNEEYSELIQEASND